MSVFQFHCHLLALPELVPVCDFMGFLLLLTGKRRLEHVLFKACLLAFALLFTPRNAQSAHSVMVELLVILVSGKLLLTYLSLD